MSDKAFQDYYLDSVAQCYGCGRLNADGLQIKTFWEGEESVTRYRPRRYHTAIPGFVYGGLIASLVDCHGTGTLLRPPTAQKAAPWTRIPRFAT